MDLREISWDDRDWIDLAQDRDQRMCLVKVVMNFRVLLNVGKFLNSYTTGGFSKKANLHGVILVIYWTLFRTLF
jgi:hypothetical protein